MAMLFLSTSEFRNEFDLELEFWRKKLKQSKNSIKRNSPRLIETSGEVSTNFKFDGKEVDESCGVTFQNKHFIFGGNLNKRQVLQVKYCGLTTIGSTPFDHFEGACGSTDALIILCFDTFDAKRCRQATLPTGPWTQMALSTYDHRWTSIASSPGYW